VWAAVQLVVLVVQRDPRSRGFTAAVCAPATESVSFPGHEIVRAADADPHHPVDVMETPFGFSGPSFDLGGRLALVTGGGRGLGRSIAMALGSAGADVALVARSHDQLADVSGVLQAIGCRCSAFVFDVATDDAANEIARTVMERCGPTDIVVHVAGTQVRRPALELDRSDWEKVMSVNVTAPFFLSQSLMRHQPLDRPVSRHIFVTSLTSSIGVANTAAYAASKSAVMGVVRSLAVEWASLGVTVNAVQPGYYRTQLTEAVFADPERRAWIEARIPLGRPGVGGDLGGAVVFLASDASSYVTGQTVTVDGGWLAS
jgi:2-deoxy-D-gluconate 3-dehydrogenase